MLTKETLLDPLIKLRTPEDFKNYFISLNNYLGTVNIAMFCVGLKQRADEEPTLIVTYPSEWVEHYKLKRFADVDPVLSIGFNSIEPINWATFKNQNSKQKALFEDAQEFGVGSQGITIPVRGRTSERGLFSFTSNMKTRDWSIFLNENLFTLQILANSSFSAFLNLTEPALLPVKLTPRETECLKWTSNGKTALEIALILNLSPNTIKYYLETARHKLKATTISQAVTKAIYLNLLTRSW